MLNLLANPESVISVSLMAQVFVISIFSSFRWTRSQIQTLTHYPPSQYPHYYIFSLNIEWFNCIVLVLLDVSACLLVSSYIYGGYFGDVDIFLAWALCTLLQVFPSFYSVFVLQISSRLRHKKIRYKKRNVSMVGRSIFDYISISYLFLLLVSVLLTINVIVSNEQLTTFKRFSLIALFLTTNFLLVKQVYNTLYGKSYDKLITDDDKAGKRSQDVQRGCVGIAASVAIFSLLGSSAQSIEHAVWLIIPLSLFVQLSVLHRSKRWYPDDMSVYRNNDS